MKFFSVFFASLLAFVVGNMMILFIVIVIFASAVVMLGSQSKATVSSSGLLMIDLVDPITDSPMSSPLGAIDFNTMSLRHSSTILSVVSAIERATHDPNIEGIYLNIKGEASLSTLEELRGAIEEFRLSGKPVVSYADSYSQSGYYLASVADKVFLHPEGGLDWRGVAANVMFYKGALDKLGIKAEVVRHGTYKAAVEPFINTSMSPENRAQTSTLVNDIWGVMLGDVSHSRSIDSTLLSRHATELALATAEDAKRLGFVDSLLYRDQVNRHINMMLKDNEAADSTIVDSEPAIVSLFDYIAAPTPAVASHNKNQIAVIYLDGQIVDRPMGDGYVSGDAIAARLARVRGNSHIKALVLRINSPGGSALASDIIWREVELVRKSKPVIVSMGGVAASGGYYAACPADMIIADRTTITGSIGVFGLLMNAEAGLRDKLGITVEAVATNPSADMGVPFRGLTSVEQAFLQRGVESVYTTFVEHVAAGRNLSIEAVDKVAQGRVWSGVSAAQVGLIDGFGGIKHAIALAADRAGVATNFSINISDNAVDPLSQFFNSFVNIRASVVRSELGDFHDHYKAMRDVTNMHNSIQTWLPGNIQIQ